jgi:putative ABC transport system ATP-binding protein
MIRLSKVSKIFQTQDIETTAVNNVDLTINSGDFLTIMGSSGCGKSTLLSILGMLDSPSLGTYEFNGEDISNYNERQLTTLRKNNLSFVFQSFNLINELTVYENVELPLIYQKIPKKSRQERVDAILKRVQIDHRTKHFPQQLSGGQQQRVAVARALVTNPLLILADEPTGNLDSRNSKEIMEMLKELNKEGTTIVMVTHSEEDALYSTHKISLSDGKIITENNITKEIEVKCA